MTTPDAQYPTPTWKRRGFGIWALGIALAACSAPPLSNGKPSAGDLGQAVLDSYERRDAAGLRALALSEQEFRDQLWPELPAARPERNLPFSYVWGDLHQKSEHTLAALLEKYGGRRFELVRVEFPGGTSQYESFLVHRDTVLVVRGAEGVEQRLRLYGSTLQRDGAFRVFSYAVDE